MTRKAVGLLIFLFGVALVILPDLIPGEILVDIIVTLFGLGILMIRSDVESSKELHRSNDKVIEGNVVGEPIRRKSMVPRSVDSVKDSVRRR